MESDDGRYTVRFCVDKHSEIKDTKFNETLMSDVLTNSLSL